MKKILITLLLSTLPSLSYSRDSEFIVSYKGTIMLDNFSVIAFPNTNAYSCDISILGVEACKAKVENEAILACQKEIKDYIRDNNISYRFRTCEVV